MTTQLLTPAELAEMLRIPLRTLDQWRYRGLGPAWIRVGRHIRYPADEATAWLDANKVTPR